MADRAELIQALSVLPEYLRNAATESGAVVDYRDWQVPLGPTVPGAEAVVRAAVVRRRGPAGPHPVGHVGAARQFAGWVRADDRFEIVAPYPFSLVCFRLRGPDEPNEELLERLNATGEVYLTHTRVRGAFTLRLAIGSPQTTVDHVAQAWRLIQASATA